VVIAAGRSLPDTALRAKNTMMAACFDAELITEITLQPVAGTGSTPRSFSPTSWCASRSGIGLDNRADVGPVIAHPVRTIATSSHENA